MAKYIVTAEPVTCLPEFKPYAETPFLAELAGRAPWEFWHRVTVLSGPERGKTVDLPPMFRLHEVENLEVE